MGSVIEADNRIIVAELDLKDQYILQSALTPRMTKYIPHTPTPVQKAFLLLDGEEAFYGGAAGGGKSDALLMAALQYVDLPGYSAILFRKTYQDLALPDALMSRAREWLAPFRLQGEVHWDEKNKTWTFPSGATLSFGYLEHANDKYRYQGAAFHFIGFDELTQIDEDSYIYLFSRNRRLASSQIPLRLRAASNPGGEGHEWVKQRFLIEGEKEGRVFIPAMLDDNPYLDRVEYIKKLMKLDPVTRAQLLEGNWEVRHGGSMFSREWFPKVKMQDLPEHIRLFRFWDLAASEVKPGKKPAFTCGLLLGEKKGFYWIINVQRARKTPFEVERMIQRAAEFDKYGVTIGMEQEPGSAGINVIDHYARVVLKGYTFKGIRATGSKTDRAKPASASAEQGYISVVEAPWNSELFDELEVFPDSTYRDQADSLSGAHQMASRHVNYDAIPISVGVGPSYWGRNFSSMN